MNLGYKNRVLLPEDLYYQGETYVQLVWWHHPWGMEHGVHLWEGNELVAHWRGFHTLDDLEKILQDFVDETWKLDYTVPINADNQGEMFQ